MKAMFLALCVMFSGFSQAALIKFEADKANYQVGDTVSIAMVLSSFSRPVAAAFVDFGYTNSFLQFLSAEAGNGFDDGLGSYFYVDSSIDGIFKFSDFPDFSADEAILAANQGSSFVLATIKFRALDAGFAELVFDTSTLFISDFSEEEFAMESDNLEFNIAAAQVPAPATALLLLAGLACLYRRQQQK